MEVLDRIRDLLASQRAAEEREDVAIPGFSDEQLENLQAACGHALSRELRSVLQVPGLFDYTTEIMIADAGLFGFSPPETLIADAASLREAAEGYGWELPRCCSLYLVNNEFLAYDLDEGTALFIDGNDGEVTDLGFGLEGLFAQFADGLKQELGQ
jgi:hypothetical protein